MSEIGEKYTTARKNNLVYLALLETVPYYKKSYAYEYFKKDCIEKLVGKRNSYKLYQTLNAEEKQEYLANNKPIDQNRIKMYAGEQISSIEVAEILAKARSKSEIYICLKEQNVSPKDLNQFPLSLTNIKHLYKAIAEEKFKQSITWVSYATSDGTTTIDKIVTNIIVDKPEYRDDLAKMIYDGSYRLKSHMLAYLPLRKLQTLVDLATDIKYIKEKNKLDRIININIFKYLCMLKYYADKNAMTLDKKVIDTIYASYKNDKFSEPFWKFNNEVLFNHYTLDNLISILICENSIILDMTDYKYIMRNIGLTEVLLDRNDLNMEYLHTILPLKNNINVFNMQDTSRINYHRYMEKIKESDLTNDKLLNYCLLLPYFRRPENDDKMLTDGIHYYVRESELKIAKMLPGEDLYYLYTRIRHSNYPRVPTSTIDMLRKDLLGLMTSITIFVSLFPVINFVKPRFNKLLKNISIISSSVRLLRRKIIISFKDFLQESDDKMHRKDKYTISDKEFSRQIKYAKNEVDIRKLLLIYNSLPSFGKDSYLQNNLSNAFRSKTIDYLLDVTRKLNLEQTELAVMLIKEWTGTHKEFKDTISLL